MRCALLLAFVVASFLIAGCGESGGGTTTAAAGGGASPPPPPGGAPPPPGAPGEGGGPPNPGEGTPSESPPESPPMADGGAGGPSGLAGGGEGTPLPAPSDGTPPDANPGAFQPPATGSPDGTPPGDSGNPGQPPGDNPDGTPRPPPPPRTLHEQALAAFRSGNGLEGYKLLSAHYVVMPAAKAELLKKMGWYPALFRPALAPRIGIAVHLSEASRDFAGDPMAIGSAALTAAVNQMQQSEQSNTRIGGDGNSSRFNRKRPSVNVGEGGTGGGAGNLSGAEQLTYYTGDFGDRLMDALLDRIDAGDYGTVLRELFQQASRPAQRSDDPNNPGESPGGDPSAGQVAPGPADAPSDGGPQPGGRRAGRGRSAPGGSPPLPGNESEGGSRRFTSRTQMQESASLQEIRQIEPCIVWLGKESERSLITKRAEAAGVDVLAIFEMTLRPFRDGNGTSNTLKLRMFTTKNNKPLPDYTGESLVNLDVEKWRQKTDKGIDPVDREVLKAIGALDNVLKPAPFPDALTAERIKKRIDDLVAEKPAEPLPVLVEARFYAAKGLLPEADFEKAAVALLGESGYAKLKERAKDDAE